MNYKYISILILLFINLKGKIVELNDQNYKEMNNVNPYLFVMAYENDCKKCIKFQKKYKKFAKKINTDKKLEYKIARINISKNNEFKTNFNIEGSPVFFLLIKGIVLPYHHEMKISSIKFYLELQFNKFIYDLPQKKPDYDMNKYFGKIIFCHHDDSYEEFEKLLDILNRSLDMHLIIYKLSKKGDCYKFKMENGGLYYSKKGYPEKYKGDTKNFEELRKFCLYSDFDIHNIYDEKLLTKAVQRNINILILHNLEDNIENVIKSLFIKHIKHKYIVFNTNGFQDEKFLTQEFGIKKNEKMVMLFDSLNYKKYKLIDNFDENNLIQFLDSHQKEKLEPFLKSEDIVIDEEGEKKSLLKKVVGNTYQSFINDNENDKRIILLWYEDDKHKESIEIRNEYIKIVEKMDTKYDEFKNISFGIINLLYNDIKDINYAPILYCFNKEIKLEFKEKLELKNIIKFFEKCTNLDINNKIKFYDEEL